MEAPKKAMTQCQKQKWYQYSVATISTFLNLHVNTLHELAPEKLEKPWHNVGNIPFQNGSSETVASGLLNTYFLGDKFILLKYVLALKQKGNVIGILNLQR